MCPPPSPPVSAPRPRRAPLLTFPRSAAHSTARPTCYDSQDALRRAGRSPFATSEARAEKRDLWKAVGVMGTTLRRIGFDEFVQQLQSIFDALAAEQAAILVERNGQLFRVEAQRGVNEGNIWADYDPARTREALLASAGGFSAIDTEALKRDLREQR